MYASFSGTPLWFRIFLTRYLYSCGSMHTSLYVCMCTSAISMVHSVTARLRLVQKIESELVLTLHQHKYKSPKYLCMVAELEF